MPSSDEELRAKQRVFEALSDETRLKMLYLLAERDRTADELARLTGKARSTIEKHLDTLASAGLIARTKVEKRYLYSLTELARQALGEYRISAPPPPRARELPPLLLVALGAATGAVYAAVQEWAMIPLWLYGILIGAALRALPVKSFKRAFSFLVIAWFFLAICSAIAIGQTNLISLAASFTLSLVFLALGVGAWLALHFVFQQLEA